MKKIIKNRKRIIIYQAKGGGIELKGDFKKDTIWASLDQIVKIFGRDKSVISRHIKNIFISGELDKKSVVAFFATTAADGKVYNVEYFNLDMILSVGYRVNSKQATGFRQWANKILREHITKGYTINPKVIKNNYDEFQKALGNIKSLLPPDSDIGTAGAIDLISAFAETWLSLDAYDQNKLAVSGVSKKTVSITAETLVEALAGFKDRLRKNNQVSEIFGQEKQVNSVKGIAGNVMQSFGGQPLYPTIEEKAANLLYFIIKDHPFVDGNKRSGAYAFIWFLNKAGALDMSKISPSTLTALTLLIAESDPKHKEKMIGLVLQLLRKDK